MYGASSGCGAMQLANPRLGILLLILGMSACTSLDELDARCADGDERACQEARNIEAILVRQARCDMKPNCPETAVAYRSGRLDCWHCVDRRALLDALR